MRQSPGVRKSVPPRYLRVPSSSEGCCPPETAGQLDGSEFLGGSCLLGAETSLFESTVDRTGDIVRKHLACLREPSVYLFEQGDNAIEIPVGGFPVAFLGTVRRTPCGGSE
jgi:hypothetical protein